MNFPCFCRHFRNAWQYRTDAISFLGQLLWRYAHDLPEWLFAQENVIRFRYPEPIGDVTFKVRNNASDVFIFEGIFTYQSYNLGLTSAPKTILDLGANAGFTVVYFNKRYPDAQIACVEPMPRNLDVLRANLELNQVNAQIFPAAVAIKDGSILMEIAQRDYSHKVAGLNALPDQSVQTLEVPAVTISTICSKLGWDSIDFLKMDIEGYERVLFSEDCSWVQRVKVMCVEWHGGSAREHLFGLAKKYGFNEPRLFPGTWLLDRP